MLSPNRSLMRLALVAIATASLAGCDSGGQGIDSITPAEPAEVSLTRIDVSPLDASILVETTLQLTATATLDDVDETEIDVTNLVTWTSSDETVATISAGGVVTGLALGTTMITAVDPLSGLTGTTSVIVTDVLGLSYVVLSRGSVVGGGPVQVTGTAVLTAITDEDFELTLGSTNENVVTVPVSVVVPAGANRVSFEVGTVEVTQKTRVFVWAFDGDVEKRASLNVRKPKKQQ
jgi:trimeric autotransporter adhesin